MSSVVISGDTSGTVTLAAPAVAGSNTITLQAATATISVNTLATAVATTSGTSIDFTGLPSWVKRITVMFGGVSASGTSNLIIQLGAGSITTTGYLSTFNNSDNTTQYQGTTGLIIGTMAAANNRTGIATIVTIGSNLWVMGSNTALESTTTGSSAGKITLSGTLDRLRITTVNGTDTFDAGTINLMYEG